MMNSAIAVRHGASKGVEDGHRLPALWAGYPLNCLNVVSGVAARRALKDQAWQARVKILGGHGHPLPYAHDELCVGPYRHMCPL
jgi:hypothetical protein